MMQFIDHIAAKKIIVPALNSIIGGSMQLFESSGLQIKAAIQLLVARAVASGDIRADLDPLDFLRALVGIANVASAPDWEQSVKRLIEILLFGSRPSA